MFRRSWKDVGELVIVGDMIAEGNADGPGGFEEFPLARG